MEKYCANKQCQSTSMTFTQKSNQDTKQPISEKMKYAIRMRLMKLHR